MTGTDKEEREIQKHGFPERGQLWLASRSRRRGAANSTKLRIFSGKRLCPACSRLTGSFFIPAGAAAFKRDIPDAEIRFFDAGHFALETHAGEIAKAISDFLARKVPKHAQAA